MSWITDHIARAIALLPWRLRKTRLIAFLSVLVGEVQELEDTLKDVVEQVHLPDAEGVQLDLWGKILEVDREGLSDPDYKAVLQTELVVNRSSGEINRLLNIARILYDTDAIRYVPQYPAGFRLEVVLPDGVPVDPTRIRLAERAIDRARPAGVGSTVIQSPAPYFGFLGNPNALGFGAGQLASVIMEDG